MINNNHKFSSSNYLLKSDAINKYNLKNVFNFPEIKYIKIRLNVSDLLDSSSFMNQTNNASTQLFLYRASTFLYLLFGCSPTVKMTKSKSFKKFQEKSGPEDNFYLEITLKNTSHINAFLQKLSLETFFFKENLMVNSLANVQIQNNNMCSLNTKIPLSYFFEINEFAFSQCNDMNLEKIQLHTSFIYINIPQNVKKVNLLAQNLFFFV